MSKTYLVNLTAAEIEALTCDYLLKGCASKCHYNDTVMALSKLLKIQRQIKVTNEVELHA